MKKQSSIALGLALSGLLLLSTMVLASPLQSSDEGTTPDWRLLNGAFDEWEDKVPLYWKVYPGNADAYGVHLFPNHDATGEPVNRAFVFEIENHEAKENLNAYLYQELTLSSGDYSFNARTVIYGTNTSGHYESGDAVTSDAYTYVAYYALVPQADVMLGGDFEPDLVAPNDWKELWLYSTVCDDKALVACNDVERAEMVTVDTSGKYVFILRAKIQWPNSRAYARYIFDDLHIIPSEECVTLKDIEGAASQP
ncbi:MAG: hypothetical protein PVF45_01240 [Anaerolineae bacterium]|jgi:hypothetical protein